MIRFFADIIYLFFFLTLTAPLYPLFDHWNKTGKAHKRSSIAQRMILRSFKICLAMAGTKLIVDGLRKLKEKRQVIVVTHNPNIPVNAASEKIFEMDFINGQIHIKEEGTIQESNIRDSICQVMEGGEDALEHRFNKIIKFK